MKKRKQYYSYFLDTNKPRLLRDKKRYFFPFIIPFCKPPERPFIPLLRRRQDKPYIIRILAPSPLYFPEGIDAQEGFINYNFAEFKSLLRSPQNNKNAQEQFAQVKYAYLISYSETEKRKFVRASNMLLKQGCSIISSGSCFNNFHSQF